MLVEDALSPLPLFSFEAATEVEVEVDCWDHGFGSIIIDEDDEDADENGDSKWACELGFFFSELPTELTFLQSTDQSVCA